MPNQRQPGTKLAGAYISAEKDNALAELAAQKGFMNKAEFIRVLFDDALAENEQAHKRGSKCSGVSKSLNCKGTLTLNTGRSSLGPRHNT